MSRRVGYLFSNGEKRFFFKAEHKERLKEYCDKKGIKMVECLGDAGMPIFDQIGGISTNDKNGRRFSPGWNPGLGEYVKDKGHYKDLCKIKNLEPIGDDKPKAKTEKETQTIGDKELKEISEMGVSITGEEAKALKKGDSLA